MNSRIIITLVSVFFIISGIFLAFVEKKQMDENLKKNWWVLYFENPKDNSLNFTIENHSNQHNFHWEILNGENKIKEGALKIKKGESGELASEVLELNSSALTGKILIRVSNGEDEKEIYKILEN